MSADLAVRKGDMIMLRSTCYDERNDKTYYMWFVAEALRCDPQGEVTHWCHIGRGDIAPGDGNAVPSDRWQAFVVPPKLQKTARSMTNMFNSKEKLLASMTSIREATLPGRNEVVDELGDVEELLSRASGQLDEWERWGEDKHAANAYRDVKAALLRLREVMAE